MDLEFHILSKYSGVAPEFGENTHNSPTEPQSLDKTLLERPEIVHPVQLPGDSVDHPIDDEDNASVLAHDLSEATPQRFTWRIRNIEVDSIQKSTLTRTELQEIDITDHQTGLPKADWGQVKNSSTARFFSDVQRYRRLSMMFHVDGNTRG